MPADILSRAPVGDADFTACNLSDKHINYVTINNLPVAVTLDELQKASETDPIMNKVRTCVLSNKCDELKPCYQIRSECMNHIWVWLKQNNYYVKRFVA